MPKYTRTLGGLLMVAAIAACGGEKTAANDTTLNKDLQMAGGATGQPQLNDAAKAEGGATKAPARTPAKGGAAASKPSAPAAVMGTIAEGTSLVLHPSEKVCTNTHKIGDHVTATVAEAVSGTNGVSIPAGATVSMTITHLKRSENARDPIDMGFEVNSVAFGGHTYPMSATVESEQIDKVRNEPKEKDVQKVVGGAVVGAIAGKLLGKDTKGAVVGAAAGAAAGAGVAAATANYEGCIAQGSNMTVKLNSAVQVQK
ncbi:MAG TPA: hypothetical protein VG818_09365 [Gemmatimonadaceae bacterium]|nr:hypothetical protein [Gemmatimonadaceae bacterium]